MHSSLLFFYTTAGPCMIAKIQYKHCRWHLIVPDKEHFSTKKYWYFSYFCMKLKMCPQYTDAPAVRYLTIKLQNSTWYKCLNLSLTGSYVRTYTHLYRRTYIRMHIQKTEKLYAPCIIQCGGIKMLWAISAWKHMLWVLIWSALVPHFKWVPPIYVFMQR